MPSNKTTIIEAIFLALRDPRTDTLSRSVVTLADVSKAIQRYNRGRPASQQMSTRNPANFFKDFIRNRQQANANWPQTGLHSGFTARQVTGRGRCFEFTPLPAGQAQAFPTTAIPGPSPTTPRHKVESASLPLASRKLGRTEETWLTQVIVRLRVIETHIALFSARRIVQVDHLQMSVKLADTEIDALFLAVEHTDDAQESILITCEAKNFRDDLLEDQIIRQVNAVFRLAAVTQNIVIPMGVKVVGTSQIHVIEFEPILRSNASNVTSLAIASDAIYEISPPVPGIGR